MIEKKFDPKKLQKLNDPQRLKDIPPSYVWEQLKIDHADTLLEIGAGTGLFSEAFMKESRASKVYASDISELMIQWMEAHIVPQHSNIIPLACEEDSVPLEDGIVDVVFMINLHHELHNPLQTFKDAYRVLKPGGKIFIIDWNMESPKGPPQEIRCQPEQVKDQLLNAGFKNIATFDELTLHFFVLAEKV